MDLQVSALKLFTFVLTLKYFQNKILQEERRNIGDKTMVFYKEKCNEYKVSGTSLLPSAIVLFTSYCCIALYLFSYSVYMPCLLKKPINSPGTRTLSLIFGPTIDEILKLEGVFIILSCRYEVLLYTGGNCGPWKGNDLPTGTHS